MTATATLTWTDHQRAATVLEGAAVLVMTRPYRPAPCTDDHPCTTGRTAPVCLHCAVIQSAARHGSGPVHPAETPQERRTRYQAIAAHCATLIARANLNPDTAGHEQAAATLTALAAQIRMATTPRNRKDPA